ncbi:InlB B-repeat-containing protein, partial [Culicoidibacter larvae]
MKKYLKIGISLLAVVVVVLSQTNITAFAVTSENNANNHSSEVSSDNNSEENIGEEEETVESVAEEAPLMAKSVTPFSAGFASFDGVDLNGVTNLSYTQGQIINIDKTVNINVNFGDSTSNGKKVTVQLAKELVFQTVPGLKKVGNTFVYDPSSLPSNLQGFVSNITYTPNPTSSSSWNGYGNAYSGSITYEFINSISATPLSFTTRIDRLYLTNNAGYNIDNAVIVTSEKNGAVIESETVETLTYASALTTDLWRGGNKEVYVDQTTGLRTVIGTLVSAPDGLSGGLVEYYEVTYAYAKELAYVSIEGTTIPNTSVDDTTLWSDASWNYVKIRFNNAKITGNLYLNFDVADTTNHVVGKVYTIKPSGNQTIKPYDNPTFERNKLASFSFTVAESFKNSIMLINWSQTISLQNTNSGNAVLGQIPLTNRQADPVTDQVLKLSFDDVYMGVNRIDLYTTTNTAASGAYNINGTTTDGRSFTIPDINTWAGRTGITLAQSDITPNPGEYIKTIVWTEKSITNNFSSYAGYLGYGGTARFYGVILDSAADGVTATSTLQSVSLESGEDIHATTKKGTLTHQYVDTATALGFSGAGTTLSMLSGETKTSTNTIQWNDTQGTFVSTMKGFNFYLREAEAFEFDISSFSATDTNGVVYSQANNNIVVSTLTDNTGKKVYKITIADYAFDFRKSPNFKVNVTTKKSAGNFTIQAKDIYFAEPMNAKIVLKNFASGLTTNDIYDISDLRDETQQMMSFGGSITNLAQADFSTATSANLDGGPWTTYDYVSGKTILDLNPDGTAKYKLSVANNSGQNVSGYKAIIPIPKAGQNAGSDFQQQAFEWDVLLNNPIDVSSTNYAYTVRYSTTYTNNFDDASWKTWNEITDKTTIKAVRIVTTDVIPDGGQDEITFTIDMDPATADVQAGGVNIYNALIYRSVLGAEGAAPSEPVAIRLKTGVIKGQVFNDTDRNGLLNGTETGRNGVVVTAYEAGTTTVLETKTTQTLNGVPGSYAFLGLDKNQNVDIVFTNPTNDDSIRFSAVTSGGSTPTASATHDKATTSNLTPSAVGFDSIDAGFITPITVTFNGNTGVSSIASTKKYPGEAVSPAPTATKVGHTFNGWFTASTGGSKVTFPYTVGAA